MIPEGPPAMGGPSARKSGALPIELQPLRAAGTRTRISRFCGTSGCEPAEPYPAPSLYCTTLGDVGDSPSRQHRTARRSGYSTRSDRAGAALMRASSHSACGTVHSVPQLHVVRPREDAPTTERAPQLGAALKPGHHITLQPEVQPQRGVQLVHQLRRPAGASNRPGPRGTVAGVDGGGVADLKESSAWSRVENVSEGGDMGADDEVDKPEDIAERCRSW